MKKLLLTLATIGLTLSVFGQGAVIIDNNNAPGFLDIDTSGNNYSGSFNLEVWYRNGTTADAAINSLNGSNPAQAYALLIADGFSLATQKLNAGTAAGGIFGGVGEVDIKAPGGSLPAGQAGPGLTRDANGNCTFALVFWTGGSSFLTGFKGGIVSFVNPTSDWTISPPGTPIPPFTDNFGGTGGADLVMGSGSGCSCPYWGGFTAQPANQTVSAGATATFVVGAVASPSPHFQWYFNGAPVAGANASIYQITSAQPANAGTYYAVLSNPSWGVYISGSATLTVRGEPIVTSPPRSQTNVVGSIVDLLVSASGVPPLSYQWFFNGGAISGAASNDLQLRNLQLSNAGTYTVVITNAYGAVTSSPALLTVMASPPTILTSPRNQTAMVGWSADLTVTARGALPLTYQWFFNGRAISGASDDDLHLTSLQFAQSGTYIVVVTNAFGAVTSAPAMLNVIALPPKSPAGTVVGWGDSLIPYVAPGARFTAIAAGSLYSLAVKSDSTVVSWGNNSAGQNTVPAGLRDVIAVAGGGNGIGGNSLALKSDGTVIAWGGNDFGQSTIPPGLIGVIDVAVGGWHDLALKSDGTVVGWGYNIHGESTVPSNLGGVIAIAAGYYHSLALKSDGTVVSWGDNQSGECTVPANLGSGVAIAAGAFHSLTLKSDGTVVAWGENSSGETNVPAGLSGVIAIAAGAYHSLALKTDGTVVAWGDNGTGQTNVPAGLRSVIAIAAGEEHSLALKSDGTVVAWGSNDSGQCMVPGSLSGVIGLATGGWMGGHGLALKSDGTVVTWGSIPCLTGSGVPANLSGVLAIAAGECHSLALESDGAIVTWGDNWAGQTNVPPGLSNVLAIGAGAYHSLAVQSDRTVIAWGSDKDQFGNFAGQSTVPPGLSDVTAVAGGEYHSLALKADGTVVAWGSNNDYWGDHAGQSVVPAGLSDVVAIAAGGFHSLALKSDGTVVAWGNNTFGQSEVPGALNGVIAIAAGQYHSLALKSDGTVIAWGDASSSTVPVGLPRVIGVFAGGLRSLALEGAAPWITAQPLSQAISAGSAVTFDVGVIGTLELFYQWAFNGTNIAGATNAVFTLANAQKSDQGLYSVLVSNVFGSVTSSDALLVVNQPPVADASATQPLVISANGIDAKVVLDGTRSRHPEGDPVQYQWFEAGSVTSLATGAVAIAVLPVGTHPINLVLSDPIASSTNQVTIAVLTTSQAVEQLISELNQSRPPNHRPLTGTLQAAQASIDRGNAIAAANQLQAFENKVNAQVAPSDPVLAHRLIQGAQEVIDILSCGLAPKVHSVRRQADGKVLLNFSALTRQAPVVEASTNLVDWEVIGVGLDEGNGSFEFEDPNAAKFPQRFYRVVSP